MTALQPGIQPDRTVAVVGAGTMGQGIAQVALLAGHQVLLYDAAEGCAERAVRAVTGRLDRLVAKGRMRSAERDAAAGRLCPVRSLAQLAGAGLVIEAIVEQLPVKQKLFAELEAVVGQDCVLATNTSSLSVTAIGGALRHPGRFLGLHFFNPAPLLPLVEVVRGFATGEETAERARATMAAWGKTPVRCADTPGFVVNRIARPFYAEAFRVYEERGADPATIDAVLRECGGFAMGPFELTDLIGQDVNEAVTRSVYEAFSQDRKFTPSLAQRRLVEAGLLGRKSGRGWYEHGEGTGADAVRPEPHTAEPCAAPREVGYRGRLTGPAAVLPQMIGEAGVGGVAEPAGQAAAGGGEAGTGTGVGNGTGAAPDAHRPAPDGCIVLPGGTELRLADGRGPTNAARLGPRIDFDLALDYRTCTRVALAPSATAPEADVRAAIGLFQALGKKVSLVGDLPGMIVARTVAMLVDFAEDAAARGVAGAEDIDLAMRAGVNYPLGPVEWGRRLDTGWLIRFLRNMDREYPGGRYAPSQALRRRAALEESLVQS